MTSRQLRVKRVLVRALEGRTPVSQDQPQATPAGVLMPLWDDGQEVQVIFTKRTAHLTHHAGQVSFPGGARESADADLEYTALRETCEEIGVCDGAVSLFARMDQLLTITNFIVTPFAGLMAPEVEFILNSVEVEKLVIVPLAKVLDRRAYRPTSLHWEGLVLEQKALHHQGEIIWGATARILLKLLDVLGDAALPAARAGQGT